MMQPRFLLSISLLLLFSRLSLMAQPKTENVVLVTMDGMRWQEIFQGADPEIISNTKYVKDAACLKLAFWDADPTIRRMKLFPFIWKTIAVKGQIYGNRLLGNKVNVANRYWFSYPGYNELLTGVPDKRIKTNARRNNPNETILEFVNHQKTFEDKVAVFASWDVFHYIINQKRSGIHINAGNDTARAAKLGSREMYLNHLQQISPSPWSATRFDKFTHQYAKEYFKKSLPKLLLIAYGETDEYAHNGHYDSYLNAANKTDSFLCDIWDWIQSDENYRDKTTLIVTTDHGRGGGRNSWRKHGIGRPGSNHTWFMIMGPDTTALGEVKEKQHYYNNQLAKTIAAFLNVEFPANGNQGTIVATAFEK